MKVIILTLGIETQGKEEKRAMNKKGMKKNVGRRPKRRGSSKKNRR
jgi:hypothetical protein